MIKLLKWLFDALALFNVSFQHLYIYIYIYKGLKTWRNYKAVQYYTSVKTLSNSLHIKHLEFLINFHSLKIFSLEFCHTSIFDLSSYCHTLFWPEIFFDFQRKFRQRGILKYLIFGSFSSPAFILFYFSLFYFIFIFIFISFFISIFYFIFVLFYLGYLFSFYLFLRIVQKYVEGPIFFHPCHNQWPTYRVSPFLSKNVLVSIKSLKHLFIAIKQVSF